MPGIWAGNASGMTEDYCYGKDGKPKPRIPDALLERFKARLTISWPPIVQGVPAVNLWRHKYNTHGVCFEDWTPSDYLNFVDRVSLNNITKLLDTNGIKISTTVKYSRSAIEKAIRSKIGDGFNMYLGCQQDETFFT
ncbi:ribonuclease M-like [Daucus carota subsp. sativus]|uniref:ribonuclease M-like n=1 Tax=Daucus carota subsp. sativus TaxID=79200 RepID=UPI003082E4F4